jgi:hypothetical protein
MIQLVESKSNRRCVGCFYNKLYTICPTEDYELIDGTKKQLNACSVQKFKQGKKNLIFKDLPKVIESEKSKE